MKHLVWCIWGTDLIADEFASHLEKNNITYYIFSSSEQDMQSFLVQHPSAIVCHNTGEIMSNSSIDIIYISTLGDEHYSCIKSCLEHYKHVFCEKAMSGNYEQFLELKSIAARNNLFLGEANTVFYMPIFKKIKDMIQKGAIGTKKMIRADFGSLKTYSPENPLFSVMKKGGALMDIGIYALSFVYYFMSSFPTEELHFSFKHVSGIDESWNILLKNPNGELANINLLFRAKLPKRAIIAGDQAYFLINSFNRASEAVLVYPDGSEEIISAGESADAVTYEILAAENAIMKNSYEDSCLDITEKVVSLMDSLLKTI